MFVDQSDQINQEPQEPIDSFIEAANVTPTNQQDSEVNVIQVAETNTPSNISNFILLFSLHFFTFFISESVCIVYLDH